MKLFSPNTYINRRSTLKTGIEGSGVLLFLGNEEASINFKDNWYHYRQDSTFLYYFGLSMPGIHALIDLDSGEEIIFGDDLTIDQIVWTGAQPKMAVLGAKVGIDKIQSISSMSRYVTNRKVHYLPGYRADHTLFLSKLLKGTRGEIEKGSSSRFLKAVILQRSIKTTEEITTLHEAASLTSKMHLMLMQSARAGLKEFEMVALAQKVAMDHEAQLSFQPIVTTNGQTLHNHFYGNTLKSGDLLLCDLGAESSLLYAGDMTRTFPVDRTFTTKQKELYDVVYRAHQIAIRALRPGIHFLDIHLLAAQTLVQGLSEIGLMKGDPGAAVAAGAHTMFFQCGLGHMLGLDVHDMENLGEEYVGYHENLIKSTQFGLKSLRLGKALEVGYVVTVEPGIYIIPELIDMNKSSGKYIDFINYDLLEKYRHFGGIRVEDDFVITPEGATLLGTPLAASSDEIEFIRQAALS